MKSIIRVYALLASGIFTISVTACGNIKSTRNATVEATEWNVAVYNAVKFNDNFTGINSDSTYTVADTATINQKLLNVKPEKLNLGWTIPGADGKIWLVAYGNEPILSETITITEENSMLSYDRNIQIAFQFTDAKKWKNITQENIGKRLAVFVNGQLMSAPQVNSEITSGNCSVSIPADKIHDYLPNLNLEKLKQ